MKIKRPCLTRLRNKMGQMIFFEIIEGKRITQKNPIG